MGLYRKRPVVIEATQFTDERQLPRGVSATGCASCWPRACINGAHSEFGVRPAYVVTTIHGQETRVVLGDWIIPEPDGEHYYPCKPDIFAATYEPVDAAPPAEGRDG